MEVTLELRGTIIPAKALLEKVETATQIANYANVDDTEIISWGETLKDALWLFDSTELANEYEQDYLIANVSYAYAGLRMAMYNVGILCLQKKRSSFIDYAIKEQEKTTALFKDGGISAEEYVNRQTNALQAMAEVLQNLDDYMSKDFGVKLS